MRIESPRLVFASLADFVDALRVHIERDRPRLILDLEPVNYLDSAAIGTLMDFYRRVSRRQGRIALSNLQPRVLTMLRMTGVHEFIRIFESPTEAVAALAQDDDRSEGGSE